MTRFRPHHRRDALEPIGAPVLVIVGTRPEAVKLAPVILALAEHPGLQPVVVTTGQHAVLAGQALATFGIVPARALALPIARDTSAADLLARILPALVAVVAETEPVAVLVHGDTVSALAGALAGHSEAVPVVHLATGRSPVDGLEVVPEEGYRRMITSVADLHLAPTPGARQRLLAEQTEPERVVCTGSTAVDAVLACRDRHAGPVTPGLAAAVAGPGRVVLVAIHRAGSRTEPLADVLAGVRLLLAEVTDLELVVPMPPEPAVAEAIRDAFGHDARVHLTPALPYRDLMWLLARTDLLLTDSGGLQEEAPTFDVPVVVLRAGTERPEAVALGRAVVAGTDPERIRGAGLELLLAAPARGDDTLLSSPFGDGRAGGRAAAAVAALVTGAPMPASWVPGLVERDRLLTLVPEPSSFPGAVADEVDEVDTGLGPVHADGAGRRAPVVAADRHGADGEPIADAETDAETRADVAAVAAAVADRITGRAAVEGPPGRGHRRDNGPERRAGLDVGSRRPAPTEDLTWSLTPPFTAPLAEERLATDEGQELIELRRGGQLLRYRPLAPPRIADHRGDPWRWAVAVPHGTCWMETDQRPLEIELPVARCTLLDGTVSLSVDDGAAVITVLAGRMSVGSLDGGTGAEVFLGSQEILSIAADGTWYRLDVADPPALAADPWIRTNRLRSRTKPLSRHRSEHLLGVLREV